MSNTIPHARALCSFMHEMRIMWRSTYLVLKFNFSLEECGWQGLNSRLLGIWRLFVKCIFEKA